MPEPETTGGRDVDTGPELPGSTSTASVERETTEGLEPRDRLDDAALVVRYYLDEASRGQGPRVAADAARDPLPARYTSFLEGRKWRAYLQSASA